MVTPLYRCIVAFVLFMVGGVLPASAALMVAPLPLAPAGDPGASVDHDLTGLAIHLTLDATQSTPATTHLAYDVALADDATATAWALVGFTVIRAWNEGAAVGGPESPTAWSGAVDAHFADWATAGAGLVEGDHLGGFAYTIATTAVPSQLFVYWVTKNGADPFPVLSNDLPLVVPAVVPVPEPASWTLIAAAIALLGAARRRV